MTPWIFSFIVAFSLIATPVLAEDTNSSGSSSTSEQTAKELAKQNREKLREQNKLQREARKKALEAAKTAREDKKLESAKDLAEKLVSERAELLKKLSSGEHTKKCRAAAKAEATSAVNAAIARLGQIDTASATTTEQVRTLIKNDIVGKNRVYVGLLPAVRGMCVSDRLIGLIDSKLTPLVDRIESNGSDVTTIRTELAAAKSDAEKAYAAYKAIANNPGSTSYKTELAAAKALVKSAKTHLSTARDAIDALKETSDDDNSTENTN
jgi:hypothetical protein